MCIKAYLNIKWVKSALTFSYKTDGNRVNNKNPPGHPMANKVDNVPFSCTYDINVPS